MHFVHFLSVSCHAPIRSGLMHEVNPMNPPCWDYIRSFPKIGGTPATWMMISWKNTNQTMDDLGLPIYQISSSALFKTNDSMVVDDYTGWYPNILGKPGIFMHLRAVLPGWDNMPRSSPPPSLRPQRGEIPIVGDVCRAHIIDGTWLFQPARPILKIGDATDLLGIFTYRNHHEWTVIINRL